jgi:hypothetical protein
MNGACCTYGETENVHKIYDWKTRREDLGVDRRIILKYILTEIQ